MARAVSLKELHDWLQRPDIKKYTWCLDKGGAFSAPGRDAGGSPVVKYLDICMDMRTMDVWRITARSFIPTTSIISDNEKDNKTILDLLEEKIHQYLDQGDKNDG